MRRKEKHTLCVDLAHISKWLASQQRACQDFCFDNDFFFSFLEPHQSRSAILRNAIK